MLLISNIPKITVYGLIGKCFDIVFIFLYQVFIRELISNASDAVEKLRYIQMSDEPIEDANLPLEIHIASDDNKKTFTIQVCTCI